MDESAAYRVDLPPGFLFGTATAAYQIEGAVAEDGRGPSIWDTFTAQPDRIADASSGAVACDHYHRSEQDVGLLHDLGAGAYRFSVAWPRVQPTGSGPVNPAGLAFYDRLVDTLLAAGIAPMATLYHWDLPQPLEDTGGWLNRDTALRFGEYAAVVGQRLADRVGYWCPVNEPNVMVLQGYAQRDLAPGRGLLFDALPAAHHALLGHGLAVRALRAAGAAAVGTATNHAPVRASTDTEPDRAAARALDLLWNRLFADPVLTGRYPDGLGEMMPGPLDADLAVIAQPLDFYGVNYYNPMGAQAAPAGSPVPFVPVDLPGHPVTGFGWPVVPDGLRALLVDLTERYPGLPPLIVTENGCSYPDVPDPAGRVEDHDRIAYLDAHVQALARAYAQGVDVRGYFCWSLLDNFEWADGYTQRFGLVHVDFRTQVRTPKASFAWYAGLVDAHRRAQRSADHSADHSADRQSPE